MKSTELENLTPLDGPFRFSCNPSVPCFTECCHDLDLTLTPYDLLRLRKNLGFSPEELFEKYVQWDFSHKLRIPTAKLKMREIEKRPCPFVTSSGCSVYADRPSSCRTYPLARATQKLAFCEKAKDAYFVIREPHCKGFENGREWTLEEWKKDQGLDPYYEMNDQWTSVVCSPFGDRRGPLSDREVKTVYMAAYRLDIFKEFVFKSSLLDRVKVTEQRRERMKADDDELLRFGFDWLRFALFGEPALELNR